MEIDHYHTISRGIVFNAAVDSVLVCISASWTLTKKLKIKQDGTLLHAHDSSNPELLEETNS